MLNFKQVTDLKTEIGRWNLETAGMLVFDKRLGCLDFDSEGEEFARKMVEANTIVFKLAGILKLSYPFYRVRFTYRIFGVKNEFIFARQILFIIEFKFMR